MKNDKPMRDSSAEDLGGLLHGDHSDLGRVTSITDAELEAAIASDLDEAGMVVDWAKAAISTPGRKEATTIRLDAAVLDYFKRQGRGYQTRINAVLRHYVQQQTR